MAREAAAESPSKHVWRFFRAGGFDQVKLDTGADFVALGEGKLDQKLWVALACPTKGLEFDPKTLELLDVDKDGRIRAPEMIAAVKWTCSLLANPDELAKGSKALPLASIKSSSAEGKQLIASAKRILEGLGKAQANQISPDDTADTKAIFAQTNFNGDGIVPVDAAGDDAVKQVLVDLIACMGSVVDRSGKPGVDAKLVDGFFAAIAAHLAWLDKADKNVRPLGDDTDAAHAAYAAVKAKVDDYFARCRLAEFDPAALEALLKEQSNHLAAAAKDLTISSDEVATLPLARFEAVKPLPLESGVNPAWAAQVAALRAKVVKPLLGDKQVLSEGDWAKIVATIAPFEAWKASIAGAEVAPLGAARVRAIAASAAKAEIAKLLEKDKALEPEFQAIAAVDKLARYYRDLAKLLDNFVSFRDFYGRRDKAVFQVGTLYLDQRSCELCLRVDDAGRHATLAGMAKTCLVYCDLTRNATGEKMTIAAAFTGGHSDNLIVGRNGIFYDRKGQDWDATITKIIDNPISIRQAFWLPYKRFVRMIEEQVAKRAAAAEAASQSKLEVAATTVASADKTAPAKVEPKKIDIGTVAALGVAVGAIGTAVASLVTGVLQLAAWQLPLVLVGVFLLISGPSVVIAWLKLRQRNLGPILDANGWAVNAMAKVNIPFGGSLTKVAALPEGAQRDLRDPYAPPKSLTAKILTWLVILAILSGIGWALWNYGVVEKVLPGKLPKSTWYQEHEAAEKKAAEEAEKKAAEGAAAPAGG
ncbi:MAG: hypothetical protein IPN34_26555 [Planctomycetes bacterium]|nr:hypothetical protein [Planctomycetota bacterium]